MHGFKLVFKTEVKELHSTATLWQHEKSGAQLLSFVNDDENKVFGVTLRTPPHDSTGLPHILEHSVLCGSKKYPVREPFVELLKGSLQTFLNAFTYPDKTCYPVASANLQDFYNLVDVYLDAVFHPRIEKWVLEQEGWHLDAEMPQGAKEQQISFKGVVYNEMKGVFSSPEAVLERYSMHSLFPDTPYGLESGGDPEFIPDLTFEEFVNFHRRYYHPSNARFYFWGNDPEEKRLQIAGDVLKNYTRISAENSGVPLQKAFAEPKSLRIPYAAGSGDKAMFTLNWVLPENGPAAEQVEKNLGLAMLDHILLGMPASPLRLALLESGLGEDLAGDGLQDELRQLVFSIGLKGIKEKKAKDVETLILGTLKELASGGIPSASVEAAINSVEFELRENNTGRFPVGLAIMLRSLTTWLHSDTPEDMAAIAPLRFEEPLRAIKAKSGSGYFEGLITECLLNNRHRASILLYPDKNLGKKQAEEEEKRLQAKLAALAPAQKDALVEQTRQLKLMQETPDTPEALATIPRLEVADLPVKNQIIPQDQSVSGGVPLYFHPQPTGGICYLDVILGIDAVRDDALPLLPLLGRAMLEMGNKKRDHITINMDIARKTGGMDATLGILASLRDRKPVGGLVLKGKAAPDKVKDLFELSAELLTETELDNQEQFCRMLLEEKAQLEHGLVPGGHMVVAQRLKAGQSLTGWLTEQSNGISYLEHVRALAEEASSNWPAVLQKLLETRRVLLDRSHTAISITAEENMRGGLEQLAADLAAQVPAPQQEAAARQKQALPMREAIITPSQVNFVGRGINLFSLGYSYHGSALVILKYLRTGYLWEKVRVQGGAYGAMCGLDRASGDFFLASYRDPNIQGTLQCYDDLPAHLLMRTPAKSELEAAIVGAIGELDAYLLPEAKGQAAYLRGICHDTAEMRQKLRDEVLGAKPEDFVKFGQILAEAMPRALNVALGGNALEKYARKMDWEINRVL